jgi:hypothetical protein
MILHRVVRTILIIAAMASANAARCEDASEPLFARHVVAVFSKLGCNSGGCHGMVQGRGGFRLSLFGANPAADHDGILHDYAGRRLNLHAPESSLLLLKATGSVPHEGGQRTTVGSSDYRLLRQWIARGAKLDDVKKSAAKRLTVAPATRTAKPRDRFSLKAIAEFADGTKEDVTHLCYFEVQNREVASVDANGNVEVLDVGDTSILVRFPGEVGIATVVAMPAKASADFPKVQPHNFIDEHVLARLRQLDVHPSELCDDATFLRRVTIDVTGSLPTADEVRRFLDDKSPDKRARTIDELLARPRHAALWATKFMDIMRVTGFTPATFPPDVYEEFRAYEWLRARLAENTPYDVMVERILTATTRDGRSLDEWATLAAADLKDELDRQRPKTYASRKTMDVFWKRRMATDVDHAIRVGHAFLGLRLQCAQCHRHPNDVWTQDDLLSFANFFMRIPHFTSMGGSKAKADAKVTSALKEKAKSLPSKGQQGIVKQFGDREIWVLTKADINGPGMKNGKSFFSFGAKGNGFASVTSPLGTQSSKNLRYLGEPDIVESTEDGDRRAKLMEWLRRPNNPFFAKALVNRVWAFYMGRGIIDPPDDLSPLNPPSHPELLKELSDGFIANKYDLKWLHKTILNSRTYQQSSVTNDKNRHDRRNFATFTIRRLPAEVLLDGYDQVAGVDLTFSKDRRPPTMPDGLRLLEGGSIFYRGDSSLAFALNTFGRPERDVEVVCDCERDDQATMLQALYLANHPAARKKLSAPGGQLAKILAAHADDSSRVQTLFLTAVGRLPTANEQMLVGEHLKKAGSSAAGCEMLLWSLLNSNEFLFVR